MFDPCDDAAEPWLTTLPCPSSDRLPALNLRPALI
jgi:hypothetical protein